jgi:hypothetical protein
MGIPAARMKRTAVCNMQSDNEMRVPMTRTGVSGWQRRLDCAAANHICAKKSF